MIKEERREKGAEQAKKNSGKKGKDRGAGERKRDVGRRKYAERTKRNSRKKGRTKKRGKETDMGGYGSALSTERERGKREKSER